MEKKKNISPHFQPIYSQLGINKSFFIKRYYFDIGFLKAYYISLVLL